jgi:hypothetical protein
MWKVKRMNTARIVVLAIAAGPGLTALYLASGLDNTPPPVAQLPTVEQAETLARARQSGPLSLALRSIADANMVEARPDDQPNWRGATVNVIRYGIASPTVQK